jgi:hypothetical protein
MYFFNKNIYQRFSLDLFDPHLSPADFTPGVHETLSIPSPRLLLLHAPTP